MALIEPRTLKGFRDYLPEVMIPRERCMEIARQVFRRFGFAPIDTPALEYLEILTGKGSDETDRQIYRFEDAGGRAVGLRFDLTVPLARFVSQHIQKLGTPFKRYHIAPVWRGEAPQAGRFREFVQCDFDTIGTESVAADIETVLVMHDLLHALDVSDFTVHINNRQILTGLLQQFQVADRSTDVLRAIDKLQKIGAEGVAAELKATAGLSDDQANQVLRLAQVNGTPHEILEQIAELSQGNETVAAGMKRLREVLGGLQAAGVAPAHYQIDISIARGLDYYTGIVFETYLNALPGIGSICSGGRYDNLASLFTKQHLPGVGASLGLDRLLAALQQLERLPDQRTPAEVLVVYFQADRLDAYLQIVTAIRKAGIAAELYPEPKKIGQQLKYADSRQFKLAVIAGEQELAAGRVQIKDLKHKTSTEADWNAADPERLCQAIQHMLQLSSGKLLA